MKQLNYIFSFVLIMLCAAFFSSCGNETVTTKSATGNDSVNSATISLPASFYKRLEGTIANQPVVMHLQCYNGEVQGTYYYVKQGKTIDLAGKLDSLYSSNFTLTELSSDESDDKNPKLDCVYEQGQLKGSWRSADGTKSYLIDLKETYPEGSYRFSTISLKEDIQAVPNVDSSPVATVSKDLLIPEKDIPNVDWLSLQIVKIMADNSLQNNADILVEAKKLNADFVNSYKEDVKETKAYQSEFSESLSYDDEVHLSVLYNENGFLTIDKAFYSYTGGAHGFGGDIYYCFDVLNKKKLELRDVLTADSLQLQPILEAAFRKDRNLKPTDSLNEVLFENHLATTDNFYFTPTGIGFMYLPYEVASYADGSIFVFVPYSDLRKYIRSEFAKRLNLQ